MKTVLQYLAAVMVVIVLAVLCGVMLLYALYLTLIMCLFYQPALWTLIGLTIGSLAFLLAIKTFRPAKSYSIRGNK